MKSEKIIVEDVWLRYENRLRAFIFSKVRNGSVTDDLLQELFIKIHENIDKVNNLSRLQSWIFQVCRNLITDHFRSLKKLQPEKSTEITGVEDETDNELTSEALEDMIKMMNELSSEYCEALCLTDLDGLTQKEYAEKIGLSYSGAKSRVQRARIMLRDLLMHCCHYEFDKYGTVIEINPANCCCCHP